MTTRFPLLIALVSLLTTSACASLSKTTDIGDGMKVHTVREEFSNVPLVGFDGKYLMIDAGLAKSAGDIEKRIRDEGVDPKNIVALVITHAHADHAGGALHFRKKFGTKIIAGAGDKNFMAKGANDPKTLCPTDSRAEGLLEETKKEKYESTTADVWVSEPTDLKPMFGIPAMVYPMAGHTPGSLVVVTGKAAFVGDLFRGEIIGNGATTHFFMCDLKDNLSDIRGFLSGVGKAVTHFFVGHFSDLDRGDIEAEFGEKK